MCAVLEIRETESLSLEVLLLAKTTEILKQRVNNNKSGPTLFWSAAIVAVATTKSSMMTSKRTKIERLN